MMLTVAFINTMRNPSANIAYNQRVQERLRNRIMSYRDVEITEFEPIADILILIDSDIPFGVETNDFQHVICLVADFNAPRTVGNVHFYPLHHGMQLSLV